MIGAQSIVVAAAATEQTGREGQILRFVIPASLCLLLIIALLTLAQAYLIPWTVPSG
jgi:L-lactate permease